VSFPYLSLEAELHDVFWAAEDHASEVGLLAGFLTGHPGPALEMGCGSGRLMLPLLERGFDVEGLELSPDMLALARAEASRRGVDAVFHEGDMTCWTGPRRHASLLVPAFTLQLADDPAAALVHWHSLLEPGGALYLTTFTPFAELEGHQPENEWYADHEATLPDGHIARLETRHSININARLLRREHRYSTDTDPPRSHHSAQTIRWFDPGELEWLLDHAGFEITRSFADFNPALALDALDPDETEGIITWHCRSADFSPLLCRPIPMSVEKS
jgi:SAM-dependent methyltransferase